MALISCNSHVGMAQFVKVEAAFDRLGFVVPRRDTNDSTGAYVVNICDQYRADLTVDECRAIVTWAVDNPLAYFAGIRAGEYTVTDVAGMYGE